MKILFLVFVVCLGANVRRAEGQQCCAFSSVFDGCTSIGGVCDSYCCNCYGDCRPRESYTDPTVLRQHWMSNIINEAKIDEISIPGTRLSSSYILQSSSSDALVKTQSLDITAQLNAGIRYLDLEISHVNNQFVMQHNTVSLNFNDLLTRVTAFLDKFRTETVLIRISKGPDGIGNTGSFEDRLNSYISSFSSFFWTFDGNNSPSLNMVRRKIVILKDFNGADGQFIDFNSFNVEDVRDLSYGQTAITKLNAITAQFDAARQPYAARIVNYLSGFSTANQITPKDLAEWTNPHITKLINDNDAPYVGIVAGDFLTNATISSIIRTNDGKLKNRGNTLESGEILYNVDERIISTNGVFEFVFQVDGNIVVYRRSDRAVIWSPNVHNQGNYVLRMQPDGNLVTYRPNWFPTWASNTFTSPLSKLVLRDDGKLNIIGPTNNLVWST